MNLSEFLDAYKDDITTQIIKSYPPLYQPSADADPLPKLLRSPLGAQEHAIRGAALSLQSNRGTNIIGEMGTGKTFVAAATTYLTGFKRILVLCPPQMPSKWQKEVADTIPNSKPMIAQSITDLELARKRIIPNGVPLFVIMSRERAKLSYQWEPAFQWVWATNEGKLLRNKAGEPYRLIACPVCQELVLNKDNVPMPPGPLKNKRHYCKTCGGALWQAKPKKRRGVQRYALSEYIKNHMKGFFDLLIGDEIHEYKGRGSAQGIAAGVLADVCKKSLTLTGTYTGGYASTLFHLLYRFSPEIRTEFKRHEETRWVKQYGFLEQTTTYSEKRDDSPYSYGRTTRQKSYRKTMKEKPGLTPATLFHVIGNTVFLRLNDVARELPPYEERVALVQMDTRTDHTGFSQLTAYRKLFSDLRKALADALARGSKRLLAAYLQSLLAYPEGCVRGETVLDPLNGAIIAQMPPLDHERIYPKEQTLADLVNIEKNKGRRVLVYITHTGTRDITSRIAMLLERQANVKVAVLKANTVKPDQRTKWVKHKVKDGVDVILCHPRLVQTGLDLVEFPTICWYETDYSVYTMRQASRRSWRIGQTEPVKVCFLAYENTLQADALRLVAQKLQSSLAIEGDLPEEGLAAFDDAEDDLMMTLARQIVNNETAGDDQTIEALFAKARTTDQQNEELLVSDEWDTPLVVEAEPEIEAEAEAAPEPEPETEATTTIKPEEIAAHPHKPAPKPEPAQPTLFSWDEFLVPKGKKKRRRRKKEQASLTLFEWGMKEADKEAARV